MPDPSLTAPIDSSGRNHHLGYLDCLRGIAILMVLWVHAGIAGGIVGPNMTSHRTWPIFFIGQRGVELFYEVSAFTLFLSLSRNRRERAPLRNFYIRRIFRIAPAFYISLLLDFLCAGRHANLHWSYALAALFVNGWSPIAINLAVVGSWSVAVEFTFYLFVPLLYKKISNCSTALVFFLMSWECSVVANRTFAHFMPRWGEYFMLLWPVAQVPVFAMGILAFRAYQMLAAARHEAKFFGEERTRKLTSALLLLSSAILFRFNLGRTDSYLVEGSFCFIPLLLAGELYAWPALFNRGFAWLGKISFSLYLFPFFFLYFMMRRWSPVAFSRWSPVHTEVAGSLCAFVVLTAVSIPFSWATWRWIEVPGVELGRKAIRHLDGRAGSGRSAPMDATTSTPGFQF